MAFLYVATAVLQSALAIASAVVFRRYLSRFEFRLACTAGVVVAIALGVIVVTMLLVAAKAPVPGVRGLAAVLQSSVVALALGAFATYVLAGRALRRLRSVAREDQLADFGIWMFFMMYLGLGAMLLNPMLQRALAIEEQ